MSLTPQDVQSQQFNVRFRGFDVDEVDTFLEKVAEELLLIMTENQQLKEHLSATLKDIDSYKNQEKTFHNAIISTQKIADEILERVKREANELKESSIFDAEKLLRTARTEAEDIRNSKNSEIATLVAEIDRLEQMKNQIQDELRELLNAYLDKLDQAIEKRPVPLLIKETPPTGVITDELTEATTDQTPLSNNPSASIGKSNNRIKNSEEIDKLDDLYQKITYPQESAAATMLNQNIANSEGDFNISLEEENRGSIGANPIPNLNDDLTLSLNDPLDELETSVRISPDNRKYNR
ncbi:MAG: hypothetical protein A2511_10720 [Deltaproteobacteria bacterium RIFOXYD12_FULL_50_9]|nr:MAG: hypothetical protein A2511_10720 [Deltaproteobacteria bacterium RIFOXYD12_FULL_50_9]